MVPLRLRNLQVKVLEIGKNPPSTLFAREVYQVLRDVALGIRTLNRISSQSWTEVYAGLVVFEADGWIITLFNDCDSLDYCDACNAPDGRSGSFENWNRFGTDPVSFLSAWERGQLEALISKI